MPQKSSKNEGNIVLFEPATTDDFWKAKYLLEAGEVPYKVEGDLSVQYHIGPRLELFNATKIVVKEEDEGRAALVCHELIKRAKEKEEKDRLYQPTMWNKIVKLLRLT